MLTMVRYGALALCTALFAAISINYVMSLSTERHINFMWYGKLWRVSSSKGGIVIDNFPEIIANEERGVARFRAIADSARSRQREREIQFDQASARGDTADTENLLRSWREDSDRTLEEFDVAIAASAQFLPAEFLFRSSHIVAMAVTGFIPLIFTTARLKASYRDRRRRRLGLCVRCGYDLRGSSGRCSECGAVPAATAAPPS